MRRNQLRRLLLSALCAALVSLGVLAAGSNAPQGGPNSPDEFSSKVGGQELGSAQARDRLLRAIEEKVLAGESDGGPFAALDVFVSSQKADRARSLEPTAVGADFAPVRMPSDSRVFSRDARSADLSALSERVANYDLQATLDPKTHTVEGSETLHWTNRSDTPIHAVYFHLYLNAFEGPHSTWMTEKGKSDFRSAVEIKKGEWGYIDLLEISQLGKPIELPIAACPHSAAQISKSCFAHPDDGPETDRSVLRVELPEEVAPGATTEIKIRFHDQLPRVIARTGYFDSFHLVAQWFPKIGVLERRGERGATEDRWNVHEFHLHSEFYADFGTYNLQVTAPKGFTIAASGQRVGEPRETSAGVVHQLHQDDIHDAVFAAWDKYPAPFIATYEGAGSPKVTVETYFPSEFAASAAIAQRATLDSLKYFSDTLGPYPYPHITVVIPPFNADEAGGMEYETFFTTEGSTGPASAYMTLFTTVHEFGHGYFMGLLASNEFEEPFLDEGLNEFWDARMLGDEEVRFDLGWFGKLGFHIPAPTQWLIERMGGASHFQADPLAASSWHRYSSGTYESIYPRTALVLHDLEAQLGGDVLARGMKLYYQRWHHRHPSAADLREALVDSCDAPEEKQLVRDWFDVQVYSAQPIDDLVRSVESVEIVPEPGTELRDGGRVELTEDETDKLVADTREAFAKATGAGGAVFADGGTILRSQTGKPFHPGPFPFRSTVKTQRRGAQVAQTLLVKFEDGREDRVAWPAGERWHKWIFEGPARVESAQLDPERNLLLDVNKLDDGRTRTPDKLAPRRWALELFNWMQILFSLLGGL